jgi:phytoene dehydrogenase-like protein
VVGSGPNGLAAAIEIARAGRSVLVLEAEETLGGGTRSAELTLPGFRHDVCSAIHPLAACSPFFQSLPLEEHGLQFLHPPLALAHPFDDGSAAVLDRSIEVTSSLLGRDGAAYRKMMEPLVRDAAKLIPELLGPLRLPRHPRTLAGFGLKAIRSAAGLAKSSFEEERARSLFAGLAAHSMMPLERRPTAAFGLILGMLGHTAGWPIARGGSQAIADSLASYLRSLGGEIMLGRRVESMRELPPARAVLFDVTPRQLLRIAGDRLPVRYRRRLARYRYGPGVFKMDWALEGPVPWKAEECGRAGTVHLGGTFAEIVASEAAVGRGQLPDKPYVLVAQQSLFDPSRSPEGTETLWAYCHVPSGSTFDMTERIEGQIERFAPGFRDLVLGRSAMPPAEVERHNANYVGGDINGGLQDLRQVFARPAFRLNPYSTPNREIFICSSSTPPGGGVHGMCGYLAARAALARLRARNTSASSNRSSGLSSAVPKHSRRRPRR